MYIYKMNCRRINYWIGIETERGWNHLEWFYDRYYGSTIVTILFWLRDYFIWRDGILNFFYVFGWCWNRTCDLMYASRIAQLSWSWWIRKVMDNQWGGLKVESNPPIGRDPYNKYRSMFEFGQTKDNADHPYTMFIINQK